MRIAIVFQDAMEQGCDQVLWLHGRNLQISEVRNYHFRLHPIQVGSMNIFMVLRSDCGKFIKLVTPSLNCGTVG